MYFLEIFKPLKFSLFLFLMISSISNAQTKKNTKNKIEFLVKGKDGIAIHAARGVSLTFSNPNKGASFSFASPSENKRIEKKYFLTIDFEKMNAEILKLLTDYESDFSGELRVISHAENNLSQKIEFFGASLDNVAYQSTQDEASMFLYLWCSEINVNGVKLD